MWTVTNPYEVNPNEPLIYFIQITSPDNEYRYVGKSSSSGRLLSAYQRNVARILKRETKRPRYKKNDEPQSKGNIEYRRVHLLLAVAVERGWHIDHYPLCNASKTELSTAEQQKTEEMKCNLNGKQAWAIEDYDRLSAEIL